MPADRHIVSLFAGALLVLSASSGFPHATVIRSNPAANASVPSPREVAIFFSEQIQPRQGAISVQGKDGVQVDNGDSSVDANRRVMRVTLKPLSAGTYSVTWRVQSTDSHKTEGRFSFSVRD